jgi:hypothetical protein
MGSTALVSFSGVAFRSKDVGEFGGEGGEGASYREPFVGLELGHLERLLAVAGNGSNLQVSGAHILGPG